VCNGVAAAVWRDPRKLRMLFVVAGLAHLAFGVVGAAVPRWFFATVPPWPPLHAGQIQIAGVFDLTLAALFLVAAGDVDRYAPLVIPVGAVAEWGNALVRLGHIALGDNSPADWPPSAGMLLIGAALVTAGVQRVTSNP
jgi:hypothetical protein